LKSRKKILFYRTSGYFGGKKNLKTKEEEAENNYRMGLWHFTPFPNKRAPN
jgi:hypothetical protein